MTREKTPFSLLLVRHILPAVVVLGGIVWFAIDPSIVAAEGAAGSSAPGWRGGCSGGCTARASRARPTATRRRPPATFLDEHGRWPTDAESAHFARHGRWPDEPAA